MGEAMKYFVRSTIFIFCVLCCMGGGAVVQNVGFESSFINDETRLAVGAAWGFFLGAFLIAPKAMDAVAGKLPSDEQ